MAQENPNSVEPSTQRKYKEFEDPHYHDEDLETQSSDDSEQRGFRTPARRKTTRRPTIRRHYED